MKQWKDREDRKQKREQKKRRKLEKENRDRQKRSLSPLPVLDSPSEHDSEGSNDNADARRSPSPLPELVVSSSGGQGGHQARPASMPRADPSVDAPKAAPATIVVDVAPEGEDVAPGSSVRLPVRCPVLQGPTPSRVLQSRLVRCSLSGTPRGAVRRPSRWRRWLRPRSRLLMVVKHRNNRVPSRDPWRVG